MKYCNHRVKIIALAAGCLFASAAAYAQSGPAPATGVSNQCFYKRSVMDWEMLNSTSFIVWAPRKQPYLVQFNTPCIGLGHTEGIAFKSHDSRVCGYGGDEVVFERTGSPYNSCHIDSVTPLSLEEAKSMQAQVSGTSRQHK